MPSTPLRSSLGALFMALVGAAAATFAFVLCAMTDRTDGRAVTVMRLVVGATILVAAGSI